MGLEVWVGRGGREGRGRYRRIDKDFEIVQQRRGGRGDVWFEATLFQPDLTIRSKL